MKMQSVYPSSFRPSVQSDYVLKNGKVIDAKEDAQQMIERIVQFFYEQEVNFSTNKKSALSLANTLGELMDTKSIVMSTPVLMNVNRFNDRPLSACIMPSSGYSKENFMQEITTLHQQGMGTGFNLDGIDQPVEKLRFLNDIAVQGAKSGKEDRPVGNMAVLNIYNSDILKFANVKNEFINTDWKFNISIDVNNIFFEKVINDEEIVLRDGRRFEAGSIFDQICHAASLTGDPGLVFLERMNKRNPVPGMGKYKTTAPCAEVGLIEGESCQFGYINMAKFVHKSRGQIAIAVEQLAQATAIMTRFLDDATEHNLSVYHSRQTVDVMSKKRKIGVGICGVADAISKLGLAYSSLEARNLVRDVMAVINLSSKKESIKLAQLRGSCGAMEMTKGNRYLRGNFLQKMFAHSSKSTNTIDSNEWERLDKIIADRKLLRNISTTAIPPTGRSALIIDASPGIEPHFSPQGIDEEVKKEIKYNLAELLGAERFYLFDSILEGDLAIIQHPQERKLVGAYLATAKSIHPQGHLEMLSAAQSFTDEAVSKTINLSSDADKTTVKDIYIEAWRKGLNGVTIYIDKSRTMQPKNL